MRGAGSASEKGHTRHAVSLPQTNEDCCYLCFWLYGQLGPLGPLLGFFLIWIPPTSWITSWFGYHPTGTLYIPNSLSRKSCQL